MSMELFDLRSSLSKKICEGIDITVKEEGYVGIKLCFPKMPILKGKVLKGLVVSTHQDRILFSSSCEFVSVGNWVVLEDDADLIGQYVDMGHGFFITVSSKYVEVVSGHDIASKCSIYDFNMQKEYRDLRKNCYVF